MKILFITQYGDGMDVALRMKMEGNQVKAWIKDRKYQDIFDGLIEKVPAFGPAIYWADLIVFDDNGCKEVWEMAHRIKPCFGGSSFGEKLEHDRKFAHQIMKQIGLERFESISVNRVDQAIAHQKQHKVPHVFKPSGKKIESHHTMIGEAGTGEDSLFMLDRFKGMGIPYDSIEIEERKFGTEVALDSYFTGKDWIKTPPDVNFEHKHVGDKESGPISGEAGTLIGYRPNLNPDFFKETLDKIKPILIQNNYRGQIDLNMICEMASDGPKFYPLEYTPRLGKPSLFIEDELHITPWAKLFYEIAKGNDPDLQVHYDWAVGVNLFAFGFPWQDKILQVSHEIPVYGINEMNLEHIHPMYMKEKNDQFVVAGGDGYILCATGRGDQIYQAKENAYNILSQIKLKDSYYRRDISDKINKGQLEELGILDANPVAA